LLLDSHELQFPLHVHVHQTAYAIHVHHPMSPYFQVSRATSRTGFKPIFLHAPPKDHSTMQVPEHDHHRCWKTFQSSEISIRSTKRNVGWNWLQAKRVLNSVIYGFLFTLGYLVCWFSFARQFTEKNQQ